MWTSSDGTDRRKVTDEVGRSRPMEASIYEHRQLATPATHHLTFTDDGNCTFACPGPHSHPSRLLQRTPRCRSEVLARKVTVCPPCRRQASSAASASRICFRHHASTVALARDARSRQVQTVHPCSDASTDSHLGTCRTSARLPRCTLTSDHLWHLKDLC